ncbi:MAG TPA: biotin/lipoyl-containing protein [Longimicrobiales bacterium]|nr:biotin/lipoyl-containing protein [Longimicrobiales bacterium]
MKYFVTVSARTIEVDLHASGARVDGMEVRADLRELPGTRVRSLIVDGRSLTMLAVPLESGIWELQVAGARHRIEVVDERTRAIRAMTGQGAAPRGPAAIRAPMPGLVTRIEVAAGDSVRAGQGIVVIEAMKMENELRADADAVVDRILVEPGQAVEKGAILVQMRAAEAA